MLRTHGHPRVGKGSSVLQEGKLGLRERKPRFKAPQLRSRQLGLGFWHGDSGSTAPTLPPTDQGTAGESSRLDLLASSSAKRGRERRLHLAVVGRVQRVSGPKSCHHRSCDNQNDNSNSHNHNHHSNRCTEEIASRWGRTACSEVRRTGFTAHFGHAPVLSGPQFGHI